MENCWLRPLRFCLQFCRARGRQAAVVWTLYVRVTGDADLKGHDFLAVIDADPLSATYGKLMTTLGTDQQTVRIHHTEYVMPASGMLFANDHDVRSSLMSTTQCAPGL